MTDSCSPTTVTGLDGASIICCAHGGQVLGWTPAGGQERLWLSPLYECGPGKSIRGGVPVVFPQFSARGPLPKHGLARDRAWDLRPIPRDGAARWSAALRSDAQTLAIWPHQFTAQIDVFALGSDLRISLTISNDGEETFQFAAALHNYLRVGSPDATVEGLGGIPAQDNAKDAAPMSLPDGPLRVLDPRDVAVIGVPGEVVISDPALGALRVNADGFTDRVIWHPGPDPQIGDVPAGAESEFFCLEPAVLDPVSLLPGEHWTGQVSFTAG